ncbi:MAG: hypothetical protein ACYCW6_26020, partial [Candidatus Xenobia bacterium]
QVLGAVAARRLGRSDRTAWGVAHEQGAWVVRSGDVDVPISVCPALVPSDSLRPPWYEIRDQLPDARDAFSGGDLLVVTTELDAELFRPVGTRLGTLLRTVPLMPDEVPVFATWASRVQAVRWRNLLARFSRIESDLPTSTCATVTGRNLLARFSN